MAGKTATSEIDAKKDRLVELAQRIWDNPETAFGEFKASEWTAALLEEEGFEVTRGYAGLPTAIKAVYGSGSPVIGFLGEYDALPGMSQRVSAEKEPVTDGEPGEACGHNLLGCACAGAAIGLKKEIETRGLQGTVIFYGCPAEEVLTGKPFMARDGAFREMDVALAWHGGASNRITLGTMTALDTALFKFKGVTSHAGSSPQDGRSALDAAELMNVGANFLREHVTSDVRIHYVIKEAGTAPNIVPDRAVNWYYVRALSREAVVDVYDRLVKVARGAAMMTETELEVEYTGGCYNTLQNETLCNVILEAAGEVGFPEYSPEELEFAAALDAKSPVYGEMVSSGRAREGVHIDVSVPSITRENGYGSTDVGDVQHIVPCAMFTTASANVGAPGHSWHIASCAGHSIGYKGMINAAKILAVSAVKLLESPDTVKAAKDEFAKSMGGKEYVCPISAEMSFK